MPKPKIESLKLSKLRKYALSGGSQEFEDVAELLGLDPESPKSEGIVHAYVAQLSVAYPEDFPPDEEESEEADEAEEEATVETAVEKVSLLENGILKALEIVSRKGSTLVVRPVKPTDKVKIVLKGELMEIDLLDLPDNPDVDFMEGVTVRQVLAAAEAARA